MEREAGEKCFWKLARQAKESENRLNTLLEGNKNQITSKSPNNASSVDKTVQGLRSSLKAQYSALLSMNSVASGDLGVELSLWKNCFYKPIEEHRVKLKAATSSLSSSLSSSPSNGGKTEVGRLRNRFQGFLRSVQDFYNVLLGQQARLAGLEHRKGERYNDRFVEHVQVIGRNGGEVEKEEDKESKRTEMDKRLMALHSCHRSLIYLGDLERYMQLSLADSGSRYEHPFNSLLPPRIHPPYSRQWGVAEQHYNRALQLIPTDGNPYNQLAVVASYGGDSVKAVHMYLRAVGVAELPFVTAYQNLRRLFSKGGFEDLKAGWGGNNGTEKGRVQGKLQDESKKDEGKKLTWRKPILVG